MPTKHADYVKIWFKNKQGQWAIAQRPNVIIIFWALAELASMFLKGKPHHAASLIAFGALFTWAWLEAFQGVNYFRRLLGGIVLLMLLVSTAR